MGKVFDGQWTLNQKKAFYINYQCLRSKWSLDKTENIEEIKIKENIQGYSCQKHLSIPIHVSSFYKQI